MAAVVESTQTEDALDPSEVVKTKPAVLEISENKEQGQRPNGLVPMLDAAIMGDNEMEGSTTVLLRSEPIDKERNGRPGSLRIDSRADFTLTDTFRVGGKSFTVTLEEDYISWLHRKSSGKKGAKSECLFLSDVFAVVPGNSSKKTRGSGNAQPMEFTLHALRSCPGTVGDMTKVTFKCPTSETCQIWTQQIYHQMQNFGNRPRRLYVVVNPVSGDGMGEKVWNQVHSLFQLAQIHTDVLYTQRRYFAREVVQTLELAQYDGIIVVGGDGTFNEVLNGLLIQTQNQSGVNMRRPRFVPVTPNIRLGMIPAGFTNSVSRSVLGCKNPMTAAAQIMLGCSTPIDVSSVSHDGQLLLFSGGPMTYGFWSDTHLFSQDFSWMGPKRFGAAALRTLFTHRLFEAEVSFIPMEDPEQVLRNRERCFNRCPKCSDFDSSVESPSATSEKGASVMAAYSEVDRVDDRQWKTISGYFSSVVACPHLCCSWQAPQGMSPWGHLGNGCVDLIMVVRCSMMGQAKWLFRQRKGGSQFDLPYVHIQRVKEFRFREILRPARSLPSDVEDNTASVENLIQEVDDDELTNSRAAARSQQREGPGVGMPTSQWYIDGDEIIHSDVEVRIHRHLVSVFARGVEPLDQDSSTSSSASMAQADQAENEEVPLSPSEPS